MGLDFFICTHLPTIIFLFFLVQKTKECNDLTGCLVTLAGTIAACVADLVDWPLVSQLNILFTLDKVSCLFTKPTFT